MCGILQWAHYEQNQHFNELRQKVGMYIQKLVFLRGLQSVDDKHELSVTERGKNV